MNPKKLSDYKISTALTHKPKISIFTDGKFKCYQCTDGSLTQYGHTREEAALNYWLAL
jgi:hypothetical protein